MENLLRVLLVSILFVVVAWHLYFREKTQDKRKKVEIDEEKFTSLKEIKEITSEEMEYLTRVLFAKGGYYDEDVDEIIAFSVV